MLYDVCCEIQTFKYSGYESGVDDDALPDSPEVQRAEEIERLVQSILESVTKRAEDRGIVIRPAPDDGEYDPIDGSPVPARRTPESDRPCADANSDRWPTGSEGDTHTRLQEIVDSLGTVPTTPIPGLLDILQERVSKLVRDDGNAEYVVQRLLFAMHIYSGYKVETRGPSGCIMDVIRCLAPETHAKLVDGTAPGDLLDDDEEGDPVDGSLVPARRTPEVADSSSQAHDLPSTQGRKHTHRQARAFDRYKTALEWLLIVKRIPVTNNDESKARWKRIGEAQRTFGDAAEELEASVIDEMPEER